jgi:V/A-type H+-transporting ATPase subunit I
MSIIALRKVTLYGLLQDKSKVLDQVQTLGCLHLVSLRPAPREPEKAAPERAKNAYEALKFLTDFPRRRRQVTNEAGFDFDAVVARLLRYKQRTRNAIDRKDFVEKRIEDLEPWGEFSFPPADALAGYKLWFYVVPLNEMDKLPRADWAWQVTGRDNRFARVVVIFREEPPAGVMPVRRTHTGALSLGELRRELDKVEIELDHLVGRREAFTRYIHLLQQNLHRAEDRAALNHAGELTLDTDAIFALQGWLAQHETSRLQRFAESEGLAVLVEPPGPDDKPPTLLENPPALRGGEDLLTFYQTPGYRDWDPSILLLCSFTLFFAMILADAGYGLLLAGVLGYYWRSLGGNPGGRRFRIVATAGLGMALIYGIMVGSYFGITPPESTFLYTLKVLDVNDIDAMMEISIIIGCLHLGLANGIVAYRAGGLPASGPPLGWIGVILGALVLWLGPAPPGVFLLAAGILVIGGFSSTRRVDSVTSGLLRVLDGLGALTRLTKLFGDVLSYMRLFALGLSSASLAMTFNQLAGQLQESFPGLGLLLAMVVLIVGHGINLCLAIMSGFVHGLRLNLIEFCNWGLAEEGSPFRAFAKKEMKS